MLNREPAASLARAAFAQDENLFAAPQGIHDDGPFFERRPHEPNLSWPGPGWQSASGPVKSGRRPMIDGHWSSVIGHWLMAFGFHTPPLLSFSFIFALAFPTPFLAFRRAAIDFGVVGFFAEQAVHGLLQLERGGDGILFVGLDENEFPAGPAQA